MTFWIAAVLLALVTLAAVALPVLRGRGEVRRAADYDIAVYRDQFAEVERNLKRGDLDPAEAEAAKAEIGRRILDADQRRTRADVAGEEAGRGLVRVVAVVAGIAVPALALALYLDVGHPGMEGMPLAARDDIAPQTRTAQTAGGQGARTGQSQSQGQPGSLEDAEAKLAAKLRAQPGNTQGWILLGRTRLSIGRYDGAVEAFERAVEQAPESPQTQALYGEALVMANGGSVVPKARQAFETALKARNDDPRSRFYLGLAAQQAGDPKRALELWRALVADAEPGASYLEAVSERMQAVERQLGIEPGTTFAQVKPEDTGGAAGPGGPTREQVEAAQDMSPEDRQTMIRSMVKRLAARLEESPQDVAGWRRLIRSYAVLGERDKAKEALATALRSIPDDAQGRGQLVAEAKAQDVPLPDGVEPPQSAQADGQESAPAGPSRKQVEAAQNMSPDERRAMIESMVGRLADRLEESPDDLQGWLRLARSYQVLERPTDAADAYARAAELAPKDPEVLLPYARALRAEAGHPTTESVAVSRRVLDLDPQNAEALWFTAMAELSEGDKDTARDLFDRALAQLPPDTPQTAELRKRADEMLAGN